MAILGGVVLAACAASPSMAPASSSAPSPDPTATPVAFPPATIGAFPQLTDATLPASTVAALDGALSAGVELGEAQAIAASVIVPGVGGWSGVAGDDGAGEAIAVDAQFAIASITKTVVAAQVLALAEDGMIDLDAPLGDYLPSDLDIDTNDATVEEFLAMRTGLAQVPDEVLTSVLTEDHDRAITLEQVAPLLEDPVREPGLVTEYNNLNYALLGAAIAEVTGESLSSALRSGVLAGEGLERLVYQDEERPQGPVSPPGPIEGIPAGTDLLEAGGGFLPTRALATAAGAAGAIASESSALTRWGYLLYGGFVLEPASLAAMTDVGDGYGLGCHPIDEFGLDGIGHSGRLPGYISLLYADASSGIIVAVLVSAESWNPGITAGDLLSVVEDS